MRARAEVVHPSLTALGPDVMVEPFDAGEFVRRAYARAPDTAVGELILDQRLVAGIGNIYRSEALFRRRLHPPTPPAPIPDHHLAPPLHAARRLMRANRTTVGRDTGAGPDRRWVYGRAGRPCLRCGTRIRSRRFGEQARVVYWCPNCQPEPASL